MPQPSRKTVLALLLIAVFYLGDLASGRPVFEKSEARYAEVAREMYASSDYLTPRMHGIAHITKPPVAYWFGAAGYHVLGVSGSGARLFLILAGLIFVALVPWAVRMMFPQPATDEPTEKNFTRSPEWLACMCVAFMPLLFAFAHGLTTDMFVSLCMNVSLLLFYWGDGNEDVRSRATGLLWAVWGVALLTKGPVGMVVPLAIITVFLWREKRLRDMRWIFRWWGGLILIAIVSPWVLLITSEHPGLAARLLGFEILDRVTSTKHNRSGSIAYYIPVILGGAFPWVFALPAAWRRYRAERRGTSTEQCAGLRGRRFLWIWCLVPFVFFSLIGSKLPGYILLLTFPIGILVADWASSFWDSNAGMQPHWTERIMRHSYIVFLALIAIGGVGFLLVQDFLPLPDNVHLTPYAIALSVSAMLMLALFFKLTEKGGVRNYAIAYLVPFFLVGSIGYLAHLMIVPDYLSTQGLARAAKAELSKQDKVVSFGSHPASWDFYMETPSRLVMFDRDIRFEKNRDVHPVLKEKAIRSYFAEHSAVVILRRRHYDTLQSFSPNTRIIAENPKYMVVRSTPGATPGAIPDK